MLRSTNKVIWDSGCKDEGFANIWAAINREIIIATTIQMMITNSKEEVCEQFKKEMRIYAESVEGYETEMNELIEKFIEKVY